MTRMVEWVVDDSKRVMAATPESAAMKTNGGQVGFHWEAYQPEKEFENWIAQWGRVVVSNPEKGDLQCYRVEHG